ncbi:MAG: hypothetical protein U0871_26255 [Gemmataceae bacterium]
MAAWIACLAGPAAAQVAPPPPPKPAPKPAARAAVPLILQPANPNEDVILAQIEQQFVPQFRQLHRAELHFLRVTADPTRQQYEKVAADGEAAVKAAARECAKQARGMARDGADPRQTLAAAVAKSARAHLTPDQFARYERELDLRTAARKRMCLDNLVVLVDALVLLSADQRRQLAEVLAANWQNEWYQTMYFQYGGQYLPPLPRDKIRALLTDRQRSVWDGMAHQEVRFGVNFQANGVEIEDEVWADPVPPAKGDDKR